MKGEIEKQVMEMLKTGIIRATVPDKFPILVMEELLDELRGASRSWEEHLKHFGLVLRKLEENSWVANRKKCEFGMIQIRYLGHLISERRVKMDQDEVRVVMDWEKPKTLKALRGFLGLTGYYRRFVKDYGKISKPLTELLKKGQFTWIEQADVAMTRLKEVVTTAPVLILPDFDQPFHIECDAPGGVGAVLTQGKRPITFFSKALSEGSLNKSIYEKELMALVMAIRHWRPYLLGQRFVVHTDQRSLRYLLKQRITTQNQQNWIAKLLGYDFEIMYKSRDINRVADALSRKKEESTEDEKELRVVDEALKKTGGHSGVYRTYHKIAQSIYWIGMKKAVTNFVASCLVCQQHKYLSSSPQGLLLPLPIPNAIWEEVSMDFIVKLPKSQGYDVVLVVVDRLSKYGHFIPLKHPYSARTIAEVFVKEIVRLHAVPMSIVSDKDPLFLSIFWKELFKMQGTQLQMSIAYHLESDGQTEVLNRVLEGYLRCFCLEQPKGWSSVLQWAEYWYNTSYQEVVGCTLFERLYGRSPPSLHRFVPGETLVEVVDQELQTRDEALK
ncbi:uncharacterized protein LOC124841282 [Vigna umbellata]|uniref:uncharacterized protein LOC124841282 n=1 Tax=Vigna umbellata TaxID=87088 RepID=UPI001F5F15AE|nr:uncharacterized protein LOC124841282 [Vigna umbellata]